MNTLQTISHFCPQCRKYGRIQLIEATPLRCPHCQAEWGKVDKAEGIFDRCPVCTCRQFYTDKDFNQIVGFLIMGVGIVLVPKTYGLSLPCFAFLDWLIYRKVPKLIACYRCGSEFRGKNLPDRFRPFMHHIGLKYDKYR